jgi:hypothetical protein
MYQRVIFSGVIQFIGEQLFLKRFFCIVNFKETVSRDFLPLFFFINQLTTPRPLISTLKYFWILIRIHGFSWLQRDSLTWFLTLIFLNCTPGSPDSWAKVVLNINSFYIFKIRDFKMANKRVREHKFRPKLLFKGIVAWDMGVLFAILLDRYVFSFYYGRIRFIFHFIGVFILSILKKLFFAVKSILTYWSWDPFRPEDFFVPCRIANPN